MKKLSNVVLKEISYPIYSKAINPSVPSVKELEERLYKCKIRMEDMGLSHLIVYGDREHFANLMYLINFDPRFEEALLIISLNQQKPLLLVGNEGEGHLGVSPLWNLGLLRYECYQTFSLMNQPRNKSRNLKCVFQEEGIGQKSRVGVVGWKYFSECEMMNARYITDIPSYIADILRSLVSNRSLINATEILISPVNGLRSSLSTYEISLFEYSNMLGADAMTKILSNFRTDVIDYDLIRYAQYTGYPLSCHMSIKSTGNLHYGLSSPTGDLIKKGNPCSISIAYWGSNICRAGWVAYDEKDLPSNAKGYINDFVAPYFIALREWFKNLKIGTKGGDLYRLIANMLPFEKFGVYLNPGHLIHYDEWISSPIYENSTVIIRSGMYIQADIIPRSTVFGSSRMEDGFVIADAALREELSLKYPDVFLRCMARRHFMESIGFELPEEILPLSDIAGIISPFFLNKDLVLSFI